MKKIIGCLVIICFAYSEKEICAQDGAWISQTIIGAPGGNALAGCGESCAGVTWQTSQYVYFFDINSSQWMEVDLGIQRIFHDIVAEGQTIMAYSDSLLIGYSAITSQWDTIRYSGTLLNPNNYVPSRGYGCGENLAYFLTDSHFYIFDSQLGTWRVDSYNLPSGFTNNNGMAWSQEDYVGVMLQDFGQNKFLNMAYSLHAHGFAQLAEGGNTSGYWKMTHGFVSEWDGASTCLFSGYSALSNQFSQIILPVSYLQMSETVIPGDNVIEKTVFACSYTELVSGTLRSSHTYGYDTRLGNWTENIFDYDPREMNGGGVGGGGGQFAVGSAYNINSNSPDYNSKTYFIYSGQSGQFSTVTPGLYISAGVYASPMTGGTVVMAWDTTNVWFYNIETGQSQMRPVWGRYAVEQFAAENYCTIGSYEQPSSDSMNFYIYYGPTNHCTKITTWKSLTLWGYGTYDIYPLTTGAGANDIYFYSTLVDNVVHLNFPDGSTPGYSLNDKIALGISTNLSYIYDATLNTVHSENYNFRNPWGLGTHIFSIKTDDYHMATYSVVTHQWSEFTVSENILLACPTEGYIGLFRTPSINKFYAFNGYYSNLVPLEPAGSHVDAMVGGKTALVVQSSHLYAFDPYASITGVRNLVSNDLLPSGFSLKQNYPNPFNVSTNIEYELSRPSMVVLRIYNALGQEVRTLINEKQTAGEWSINWDGRDGNHQPIGSGIYIYQMQVGNAIQSRKIMLIKSGIY